MTLLWCCDHCDAMVTGARIADGWQCDFDGKSGLMRHRCAKCALLPLVGGWEDARDDVEVVLARRKHARQRKQRKQRKGDDGPTLL